MIQISANQTKRAFILAESNHRTAKHILTTFRAFGVITNQEDKNLATLRRRCSVRFHFVNDYS
jgi:hypothetical protein